MEDEIIKILLRKGIASIWEIEEELMIGGEGLKTLMKVLEERYQPLLWLDISENHNWQLIINNGQEDKFRQLTEDKRNDSKSHHNLTNEVKDGLLTYFINSEKDLNINLSITKIAKKLNTGTAYIHAILQDMADRKLLASIPLSYDDYLIQLNIKAFDFHKFGGYDGEDKMLLTQIEKLRLELDKLISSYSEEEYNKRKGIFDSIIATASSVASIVSAAISR